MVIDKAIQHMRERFRRRNARAKAPDVPCCKCGAKSWYRDVEDDSWYCFKCGERGFWKDNYTVFVQVNCG